MINLVFYNSYQNSYVGFQTAEYLVGCPKLKINSEDYSKFVETEKLLTNSGCVCALGKTFNGRKHFFVYRGLKTNDDNGREWYINIGIESDEESSEQFCNVITSILLNFNAFKNELKRWFVPTPNSSFSYDLNYENIDKFILCVKEASVYDFEFYKSDNPHIYKFKNMISDIKTSTKDSLLLLVPETTINYFNKQNSFFENFEKQYIFSASVFKGLTEHDEAPLAFRQEENNNSKQHTVEHNEPINEFIEENRHTIELACKIVVGTLAIVGAGVLIKKILF